MHQVLRRVRAYGIGKRAQTEEDFHRICEAEGIEVIWSKEKFSFYFTMLGHHFIVLPNRRRGLKLLFAMFHELGHYFAHVGDEPQAAFLSDAHTKDEAEADAIALIALMPVADIKSNAFFDGSRFGGHLYNERVRLHFLFRI
jgi:Zn-dependent peptidase ImmA (M78 family)